MKKVLFTATVDSHILRFHLPYLEFFKNQGFEVHVATNGNEIIPFCDVRHTVSFERSPFKFNNILATKQLKAIIDNHKFDLIHCHTPMGGVATRIAAMKARKKGTKVLYTAHGFHFFKGAPLINWLLYYPIEKCLAPVTDCLITINQEDYQLSLRKIAEERTKLVHGVGVDRTRFIPVTKEEQIALKTKFGFYSTDFIIIYVAELNKNKNQEYLIDIIYELSERYSNIKLLLVGGGNLERYYKDLVSIKNLKSHIHFTGVRNDMPVLYQMSDLAISTSKREGLGLNLIEAMACGLPVIASNIRGHRDSVKNGVNGYLCDLDKMEMFVNNIERIIGLKSVFSYHNEVIDQFSLESVKKEMEKIYLSFI